MLQQQGMAASPPIPSPFSTLPASGSQQQWTSSSLPLSTPSHLLNQTMGPEWGTAAFQGSHRAPSFASPLHDPFPNSLEMVPASYDNISAGSESEIDFDPFHDIPELSDFNLSGAGVALSKQKYWRVPSDQAQSLWRHATGMETSRSDCRAVTASRIVAV
ncbi:hypothetical protein ACOMHN_047255 [Nucella lapillus]